jgi:uncharacterized protein (TIGR00369 family)
MRTTGLPPSRHEQGHRSDSGDQSDRSDLADRSAPVRERRFGWSDPAITAKAARELDGQAFLDAIAAGALPPPPVASALGFAPVSVAAGVVVFEFIPAEFHYNPIGSVHGGVIATLCDSACGCAVHSMLPAGSSYASLDLSVKFLRPVTSGTGRLLCRGSVVHLGSRSALAEAQLTGEDGRRYAHATSSCMIFRPAGS